MPANHKISLLAVVLFSAAVFLSAPVNASHTDDTIDVSNWDITPLDRPYSFANISAGTDTIQVVNLTTDSGEPINKSQLVGEARWEYNNTETEIAEDLQHHHDGYWYANFNMSDVSAGDIYFHAEGETKSSTMADADSNPANASRYFNFGEYVVELDSDLQSSYRGGDEITVAADVSLHSDGSNVDSADVTVYFTNMSWTSSMYSLGYNPDTELYTNQINLPSAPNSTYFMHLNASTLGGEGVSTYRVDTYESIEGEVSHVNGSDECNQEVLPTRCEPDATISTGFDITSSEAENVNITLMGRNSSGLHVVDHAEVTEVTGTNNSYEASFTVPEFPTDIYDEEMVIRYLGVNGERSTTEYYNITKAGFYLNDNSDLTAYQGSEFEIRTFIGRPETLRTYPENLLKNGTWDITDSNGEHLTNFTLNDTEFDSVNDLWTYEIDIPADAPNGSYTINAEVYNTFDRREELDPAAAFKVSSISKTFTAPDSVEYHINNTGVLHRNITLENSLNSDLKVTGNLSGEFTNYTELMDRDNITVPADGNTSAVLEINVTEFNDHEGSVTFYDQGSPYNTTTNISFNSIDCGLRSGDICLDHDDEWFNVSRESRGTSEHSIDVYNIGDVGSSFNVSVNVTGDIVQYISVQNSSIPVHDVNTYEFNLTSSEPTDATGNFEFSSDTGSTIDVGTRFHVNVTELESSMDVKNSSINLGYLPDGESATSTVTVENTGNLAIVRWFASSDTYSVSLSGDDSIDGGEMINLDLEFDSVTSQSGQVELEGQTGDSNLTDTISVSATLLDSYSEMESSIEQRRGNLESRASGSEVLNDLSDIDIQLSNLETQMQEENYEDAYNTYQDIQTTLDDAEETIEENENEDPGNGGNQNGTDPGTGGGGPDPEPTPPPEQPGDSGGGLPVLPIAIVLFLILVIGFVLYTSYIPEPGDPLYDLLGEE
jgi:hypothetical protein